MLGGIRHLIWDTGRGFGPSEREWLVAANLIGSIAITLMLVDLRSARHGRLAMSGSEAYPHAAGARARPRRRADPAPSISGISG